MIRLAWQQIQEPGHQSVGPPSGTTMASVLLGLIVVALLVLAAALAYRAWQAEQRTSRDMARAIVDETERWLQGLG
jgi:Tfp pilus assembly protein PilX